MSAAAAIERALWGVEAPEEADAAIKDDEALVASQTLSPRCEVLVQLRLSRRRLPRTRSSAYGR